MITPKTFYPNNSDTVLVLVDLSGPRDGWREAHVGRTRPDQQYIRTWALDRGYRHWILEFPDKATELPA